MSLPTITATGRLGADPELKFTPTGKAVANFRIASTESKKDANGQWQDVSTVWLGVSVWEKDAEAVAENLRKGDLVTVIGSLSTREYESNGQTRLAVEIKWPTVSKALPKGVGGNAAAPVAATNPWDATPAAADKPPF